MKFKIKRETLTKLSITSLVVLPAVAIIAYLKVGARSERPFTALPADSTALVAVAPSAVPVAVPDTTVPIEEQPIVNAGSLPTPTKADTTDIQRDLRSAAEAGSEDGYWDGYYDGTDGREDLKRYDDHSTFTTARARQVYAENYRDGYDAGYNVGINQQEASPASAHE